MQLEEAHGPRPLVITTSAREGGVSSARLLQVLEESGRPLLLVLGTGWGLVREVLQGADGCLMPISGPQTGAKRYNHLSVRSAAGIMLDRLFAGPQTGLSRL